MLRISPHVPQNHVKTQIFFRFLEHLIHMSVFVFMASTETVSLGFEGYISEMPREIVRLSGSVRERLDQIMKVIT